jgi:SAM-dependent methyltransferase
MRDAFSTRRPLDPPVGTPGQVKSLDIADADLATLAASIDLDSRVLRDNLPIPSARDREGYYGERHFEYWLSGLSDYFKVRKNCEVADWKQVRFLDFGGATGRLARHFFVQDSLSEVMVCDVNINNVEWMVEHFPPGLATFKNSALPSLPIPDGYFDIVTAFSVFTHMNEYELAWLYELKRTLKPDGLLYVTVHNDDTWKILPSTWVYNVLMQSEQFRSTFTPDSELRQRHIFEYSSELAYNCNTFHPRSYIHHVWGKVLKIVGILPICHGYQSAVVLRKERAG